MSRKCKHRYAIMLGRRRVTRVENRHRGWMYYLDCLCRPRGTIAAIAFGPAGKNAPRDEMRLAERIAREAAS